MSVHIVIAEDSPTQREELRLLLESEGHAVEAAGDGEEALVLARENHPTLIITDIVMPRMNGYELCRAVKEDATLRDIPVILLTSLATPQDILRGLECGADNFVRKPYDHDYLLARVAAILASQRVRASQKLQVGVEIYLSGRKHFINADRQQILDFLFSTYEEIAHFNDELEAQQAELEAQQAELEQTVDELAREKERAMQLATINRAVLEAAPVGIALFDLEGKSLLTNPAMQTFHDQLGIPRHATRAERTDVIGKATADPERYRREADALVADPALEATHEYRLAGPGRSFERYSGPVRNDAGAVIGRIVLLREVTAEREAERLKTELVNTVSHELRTPLTSILGFTELLATQEPDDETRRHYVSLLLREAKRLTLLVNDFLDVQRIEAGRLTIVRESVDVAELLRQQVELYAGQSAAHELRLELPSSPLVAPGDRDRIVQVVSNLLSNAVKYSPGGGLVHVTATVADETTRISVADNGLGIPADQQHRVFEKFFRADSTDTREIGGTGLGLAICREIVELHEGRVGFESVEGEGSTFWFELPGAGSRRLPR